MNIIYLTLCCELSTDNIENSTLSLFKLNLYLWNIKVKAVPLQAWSGPEGSRKLRFPDFMTTAQAGLSTLRTDHLHPQEIRVVLISFRG